jgi:hypothetical protein
MNVFYIGVENPITVTAAGYTADKVSATISAGSIVGANGHYIVKQEAGGKDGVNITVTGKSADGKSSSVVGAFNFRVKRIPDPVSKVGGQQGGSISATTMRAQTGMAAFLEGFDFNCPFQITKYDCSYIAKRQDSKSTSCTSPYFNEQIKGWIAGCKPGDILYFENIYARGCDNTPRKLPAMTFKIN